MDRLLSGEVEDHDPADRIEVRLLGPLQVRRCDGSLIHPREWRTGKTVDLLRILAVRSGRAVPVDEILEALWSGVDEQRGRGSLRNALGQLRKLLGQSAIERRPDGLVLHDAWVDAVALTSLAAEARRHAREGRLTTAVRVAREADALHLGEFRAHDPDALWAVPVREELEVIFREMILDAAEHAVDLGWMRDAIELGRRALAADATSERAFRVLMRGYSGIGETERALRTYERCRAVLAEDLGIDPSPQTRALHVQVLSAPPHDLEPPPLLGRSRELAEVVQWGRPLVAARRPGVLYLAGEVGSGRRCLAAEVARQLGLPLVEAADGADDLAGRVGRAVAEMSAPQAPGGVVVLADAERASTAERRGLLGAMSAHDGVVVVLRLAGSAEAALACDVAASEDPPAMGSSAMALQLLPLSPQAMEQLATALLSGPPTPQLMAELTTRTDGNPGRVVATVGEWSRIGALASTPSGLALVPPPDASPPGPELTAVLAVAMGSIGASDQQTLHLVALLDRPVRPGVVAPLLAPPEGVPPDVGAVLSALDRLVDLRLLVHSEEGYSVRDPMLRQAVESWLRPSVRRRMHAHIAQAGHIPAAERVIHWRAAGESELARAASMDAVREAVAAGDVVAARSHLLVVTELAERVKAPPADLAELEESLADACAATGRIEEATQHYRRALAWLPQAPDDGTTARISTKLDGLQQLRRVDPVGGVSSLQATPDSGVLDDEDEEAEELRAREAVVLADATGDAGQAVLTRLALARWHLLPRRRLSEARQLTEEAIRLAGDGPLQTCAIAQHYLPDVLLGNAQAAERPLDQAWDAARPGERSTAYLAILRCLVAHDLGSRTFDDRWRQAMEAAPPDDLAGVDWAWARVRIHTERGALAEALEEDRRPPRADVSLLGRQLRALASASLLQTLGRSHDAVELLQEAMLDAEEECFSLLVPEITARLVILTAEGGPQDAGNLLELFDWAVGSNLGFAREGYLRLLARGAVRAARQELDRAATAAATAARIAQESGLLLLASEAYLSQAQYLFAAGWGSGARVATAGAARCLRTAGTG